MKKLLLALLAVTTLTACKHENMEDRAYREAREFTRKYCPTPVRDYTRTDSMAFDPQTRTLVYYYSLMNEADNERVIELNKDKMHQNLLNGLINATNLKAYKDASFNFRYVYHSGSNPQKILYEASFAKKDYGI